MSSKDFRSALEAAVAAQLEHHGIEYGYEQETFEYKKRTPRGLCELCGGTKTFQRKRYLGDFSVSPRTIIEVKGYFTAADRAKMLAVRENNPDIRILFLFGADNKLRKSHDKRYSDWCTEHKFEYAIRTIPKHWIRRFKKAQGSDKADGGSQA